jgi:hypothetical protein
MTISKMKTFILLLFLITVAGFSSFVNLTSEAQTGASAEEVVLKEIAPYRTWTRVNETPRRSNNFQIDGQDS